MIESPGTVLTVRELVREIARVEQLAKTWIESLQRLMEKTFEESEKATDLKSKELYGRLDTLNHDRVEARAKERDFVDRKSFEPFSQRVADDFIQLRKDLVGGLDQARGERMSMIGNLNDTIHKQNEMNDKRFDAFSQRVLDDFTLLRKEIVVAFDQAGNVRQQSAGALSESQARQSEMNDKRFSSLESVQSKMIGAMIFVGACVPILAGLIIYAMTGHGG